MPKKKHRIIKKLPELEPIVKKPSKLKTDYDIAYDFAAKVYKQFQESIKSIVLFGSAVKGETVTGSDIDILIIIDDCSIQWDQELIAWYREELGKITERQTYGERLHVNTVTLSTFWEDVREGEPAAINIIRYGQPLIDFGGFFDPIKILLARGRIRPSPEAIFLTLRRAPLHISRSKFDMVNSIEHLYWSMVDSSHAALMASNQIPPSPEHVTEMLDEVFVSKKVLDKKYVIWYKEMYELAHDIVHGTVKSMSGKDIDIVMTRAIEFEKVMRNITSRLISKEKIIQVQEKEPVPEPPKRN
ncbi:nucleotidyltransferase domain-containing protein [Candidatus Woesearchaeota archaeon]|nr:nucleotidyltransferase domain-containing protein [Candidatus Woesearchaeota archaeon]